MEVYELEGMTAGYKERMRRLALFEPLADLQRKSKKDKANVSIDMHGLGLITLLFFFEHKLLRNNKVGSVELAKYIHQLTEEKYVLAAGQVDSLAKELIEAFRPPDGRKRFYQFYNWETKQDEVIRYSLLKDNTFDAASGRQYYTLDEDGLELIFATKEFYSEYQLSINQLMIRKQLEKGEYSSALRQINEMRINVESLRERMAKLKHEVMRNIVSEGTFERYKKLLEDIRFRLSRENEEFIELEHFVHETRTRLFEKDYHLEQPKAYGYILSITKELENVHNEHSKLLTESQVLINETLIAAQQSLYYMGVEAFNFKQDILLPIITKPLPIETMKGVLHPFFKLPQAQIWSPLTILQEQTFRDERENLVEESFIQLDHEAIDSVENRLLEEHFTHYMTLLIAELDEGVESLAELVERMRCRQEEEYLHRQTFYHFWLYVHQRSPICYDFDEATDGQPSSPFYDAFKLLGRRSLHVVEVKETIAVTDRYSIQNMLLSIEEEATENALQ